jgi:hypothetical protein
MSTDVYIDTAPTREDLKAGRDLSTIRIGDLSVLGDWFDYDVKEWVETLSELRRTLDAVTLDLVGDALDLQTWSLREIRKDPGYAEVRYGSVPPAELDMVRGETVRAFLHERLGHAWRVRVD